MDFRIRQLQCFLTLADLLHYGKTARVLYMSQPTITFQIKSLEEAFGAKLFERSRQQVRLTAAGVAFREYAQTILETVKEARSRLGDMDARLRLKVGCGPVGQSVLLPAVLRTLAAEYPMFELEVLELTTEQQRLRISEGSVDALLMVEEISDPRVKFELIRAEPLVAMVSRGSPLASRSQISLEELRRTPLIASRGKDGHLQQAHLRRLLLTSGVMPRVVEAPESTAVVLAYAAAGEGLAIVAESVGLAGFPGVVMLRFEEEISPLALGLASIEGNESEALAVFREVVMRCAGRAEVWSSRPEAASGVEEFGTEEEWDAVPQRPLPAAGAAELRVRDLSLRGARPRAAGAGGHVGHFSSPRPAPVRSVRLEA